MASSLSNLPPAKIAVKSSPTNQNRVDFASPLVPVKRHRNAVVFAVVSGENDGVVEKKKKKNNSARAALQLELDNPYDAVLKDALPSIH